MHKHNQKGFTQHLVSEIIRRWRMRAKHSELSAGFIPMIIMIILLIIVFFWFVYRRVAGSG
ncbi:hypothetical protein A3F65_03120 [Candidatus Saccharibacteria bacterium RIFCSPHIGHO2_12_FULL_47_16b]|nr:MAG: hypothetical protein A3F65_03120 [Candidatus Saccharibacteria bacterium RIFCSPHIGHO2_12_FULL_47_16b]OGL37991.1 MAG: hypothetical protein A3J32_00085 [Candidatus Saccharibacteria bacterium RIFCSPLOWO2_02_FULL_46_7]